MSIRRCNYCDQDRDTDLVEFHPDSEECEVCETKRMAREFAEHSWMRGQPKGACGVRESAEEIDAVRSLK